MAIVEYIDGIPYDSVWNSETSKYDLIKRSSVPNESSIVPEKEEDEEEEDVPLTSMQRVTGNFSHEELVTAAKREKELNEARLVDLARVGFGAVEGIAELGSDVLVRPFVKNQEEYDKWVIETRGKAAEYVPGFDREDIIDPETGKVLRTETGTGIALELGSFVFGGVGAFRLLGKLNKLRNAKYGTVTRAVISEQAVEQVLADPDSNLANLVTEVLMDDPPAFIEHLAAKEDDPVLFKRAKMAITSGLATGTITGLIQFGFKAVDIAKHSRAVLRKRGIKGRDNPETPEEFEEVVDSLLGAAKEGEPHPIVKKVREVGEDSAKEVAEVITQSSGRLRDVSTWAKGVGAWTHKRFFTSRGFLTRKGQVAQEASLEAQRKLTSHAIHIANRLQRFMDDAVEGNIVDDVSRALGDNKMLNLSPAEKIDYLAETDMASFLKRAYNFSDEAAANFLKQADVEGKIKFLENSGFSTEKASEIVQAKPYGFSREIAGEVADARTTIDNLSQTLIDSNIGSEVVRAAIASNMGSYMRKSYRLYEDTDWVPNASLQNEARRAIIASKIASRTKEEKKFAVTEDEMIQFGKEADTYIADLINKSDLTDTYDYLSKIRKVNKLMRRKEMLPELERLMGRIDSPTENIILTIQKLAAITENNKFYTRLMELGASVPSKPKVYDEAVVQARAELTSNQVNMIDEVDSTIKKGSYVTTNNPYRDAKGKVLIPAGTVGRVVDTGAAKTPHLTHVKFGKSGNPISFKIRDNDMNLTVIPTDQRLNKLATQYYDDATEFTDKATGKRVRGKAYTDEKYISPYTSADSPFQFKIRGTGTALDGQYTTKDLARVIHDLEDTHISLFGFFQKRFAKGMKNQPLVQLFAGLKGTVQQVLTVWSHPTQIRNVYGGFQMGMANGVNPLKHGRLNFEVLVNEIAKGGDKIKDEFYELLQGLGVINTTVKGKDSRALLDIASETEPSRLVARIEDYAKRHPDTTLGKIVEKAVLVKNIPEQVYMAGDDFFKMNVFVNELHTLRRAYAGDDSMTEDLLRIEAANLIKDNMPNYNRVTKGVKSLREAPIGTYVSFPAEILRTSANIVARGVKEINSGNSVLRKRGLQRLTGFAFLNLGWAAAGNYGYHASGLSEIEWKALQKNSETKHSPGRTNFFFGPGSKLDMQWLNAYDILQKIGAEALAEAHKGKVRGVPFHQRMMDATVASALALTEPFISKAIITELLSDLNYAANNPGGSTSDGKNIFTDPTNYGSSLIEGILYLGSAFVPGTVKHIAKLGEAVLETPSKSTGKKPSIPETATGFFTGFNVKENDIPFNFRWHVKNFLYDEWGVPNIKTWFGKDAEAYKEGWASRQQKYFKKSQKLYEQVGAMRDLGYSDGQISEIMYGAGLPKTAINFFLKGQYLPKSLTKDKMQEIRDKDTSFNKKESEETIRSLLEFYNKINGIPLHPVKKEDIEDARFVMSKELLSKAKGGEVNVPRAPREPDERIDKMTGLPYHVQAGGAFIDDEDPLKRLGFTGGGQVDPLVRLGFSSGGGPDTSQMRKQEDPLVRLGFNAPSSQGTSKVLKGLRRSRRSANPGKAAMTGASLLHSGLTGATPLTTFSVPFAGPAIGALLHTLQTKPGFNYDPQGAGKKSSEDIRRLGSIYSKTKAEKRRASSMPSLDVQVGDTGKTRRQLQEEKLLHPGGPLAFSLAHREYLEPDVRKRLAEVIPEDATVNFRELGQAGNPFTDVMRNGRRISRTPGHRLPVDDVFGFQSANAPGKTRGQSGEGGR